jgi:hypothetical protein
MRTKLIVLFSVIAALVIATSIFAQQGDDSAPVVTTTSVHHFDLADPAAVEGAFARLVRYDNGVTTTISTSELVPGEVYTLWWVIFNDPENCLGGACDADDIFIIEDGGIPRDADGNRAMNMEGLAASNVSIQHAAGGYSVDGSLNTSASLGLGDVPGIIAGPGLLDPYKAEIHLVVRTHGPKVDEYFADQLSTFDGGCDPMDALPCDDLQFAVFLPGQ